MSFVEEGSPRLVDAFPFATTIGSTEVIRVHFLSLKRLLLPSSQQSPKELQKSQTEWGTRSFIAEEEEFVAHRALRSSHSVGDN
jgi:hypothetical protein